MKAALLDKYNVPVPRYTSYPPANYFTDAFGGKEYEEAIIASNYCSPRHISYYLHIPFCRRMCHYCGCNAYPARKNDDIEHYISGLHKEIDKIKKLLTPDRKIAQIHYGGGTPTAVSVAHLKELNEHLLSGFECIDAPEIAIECHPAYMNETYWEELLAAGFNRFSIGIQDFNKEVLAVSNREAPLLPVAQILQLLRCNGAKINLDFIYGLPRQTAESFADTIRKAIELAPDRIVTFSYAHVPWVNKRQLLLEKAGLPDNEEKTRMYEAASELFHNSGYKTVGLDHFVRSDDELYTALSHGKLHRNFQGYCTRRTTGQVYAFGATGISQLSDAYSQNTKNIDEYLHAIDNDHYPVAKGYRLSTGEQICREVIDSLMCNYLIDWQELSLALSLSVEHIKAAIIYNQHKLEEFAVDGLISFDDNRLEVNKEGRLFVRNVAAALDPLMLQGNKSFSKPV